MKNKKDLVYSMLLNIKNGINEAIDDFNKENINYKKIFDNLNEKEPELVYILSYLNDINKNKTLNDLKNEYDNSPEIIKEFNMLIDIIISNFYQSKNIYDRCLEENTIKIINFSIKPNIKKWEIDYLEPQILQIINDTHYDWINNNKLHKEFENEWKYLCYKMSYLKEYIHSQKFLDEITIYLKNNNEVI